MSWKENEANHISAGPWGGQYGVRWDDGVFCTVRQVVISSSALIHSIQFEYDRNGCSVWSEKHGGSGGIKIDKVKLEHPNEYLVSINGRYGPLSEDRPVVVRCLSFQSNKKKYGPFGIQQGTHFSLPICGGKLVGFHGRSSWYLDSIGVYVKPLTQQITPSTLSTTPATFPDSDALNRGKVVSYGPWGGRGGLAFDDGIYTGVREIHLTRTGRLVSIRVCYDQNGRPVWGPKNGGSGGLKLDKIVFDYPSEVLTHITGYYESTILRGPTIIKSITFHTTRKKYGPFGDQQGIAFSSDTEEAVIVGFHGRKGYFIDGIGVHVLEENSLPQVPLPQPSNMNDQKTRKIMPAERETGPSRTVSWGGNGQDHNPAQPSNIIEPRTYVDIPKVRETSPLRLGPWGGNNNGQNLPPNPLNRIELRAYEATPTIKETGIRGCGPWGGNGGIPWDDGAYNGIRKILITRGEAICSIQIEYDRNGQSVWSAQHGYGNNACTYIIKFDYPDEVLTCISGYYGYTSGYGGTAKVIRSLTFYTNIATYGPFGEEMGTYFSSNNTEGEVVGFHGRSGTYLDAIGVHMQRLMQNENSADSDNSYGWVVERQALKAVLKRIIL